MNIPLLIETGMVPVEELLTRFLAGRRPPRRDGFFGKPQGQVAPFSQSGFIFRPVSDAVALLGVLQLAAFRVSISHVVPSVLENDTISQP